MIFELGSTFEAQFIISPEIYNGFITVFKDTNPLHTQFEFANSKGFKGVVMHGNILNGFLSYFIGECLPTKDVIIHSQNIQYKNAVYMNDELFFSTKVSGVYESVNAIEFKYSFKNKNDKVVANGKFQIGLLV